MGAWGDRLRKARLARGWTLRQTAPRLGLSWVQVQRLEVGSCPPCQDVAQLVAWADVLGLEVQPWVSEAALETGGLVVPVGGDALRDRVVVSVAVLASVVLTPKQSGVWQALEQTVEAGSGKHLTGSPEGSGRCG